MAITNPAPLRKRVHRPSPRRLASAVSSALAILAANARAAEWSIAPSVELKETYSDNIALSSDASARSDWVTEVIPAIAISATGLRFRLNAQYALHYLDYHRNTSPSRTLHEANVSANTELAKDLLFMDASAVVSQQRISAFGRQTFDNVNTTGNLAEVQTYSISPYLRHNFADQASAEFRYIRQKTKASTQDLLDGDTNRAYFDLHSGTGFHTWGWKLRADQQRVDYSNAPPVELNRYTGTLRYTLSRTLSVNAMAGHESNNYISLGDDTNGRLWSLGFAWAPSEVTSVIANTGHRYFGRTFDLSANHRSSRAVWNLGYNEDVTTQSASTTSATLDTAAFLNRLWSTSIPDANARQRLVDTFIRDTGLPTTLTGAINGLSNRVFLQKSLQASVALDGARNTMMLRLYAARREAVSAATPTSIVPPNTQAGLDDDSLQIGGSVAWTWHISSRSDLGAGADYARIRSFANDRVDHDRRMRIGLITKFGRKLSGTIEARRQLRSSTQPDAGYRENAVALSVLTQF